MLSRNAKYHLIMVTRQVADISNLFLRVEQALQYIADPESYEIFE